MRLQSLYPISVNTAQCIEQFILLQQYKFCSILHLYMVKQLTLLAYLFIWPSISKKADISTRCRLLELLGVVYTLSRVYSPTHVAGGNFPPLGYFSPTFYKRTSTSHFIDIPFLFSCFFFFKSFVNNNNGLQCLKPFYIRRIDNSGFVLGQIFIKDFYLLSEISSRIYFIF